MIRVALQPGDRWQTVTAGPLTLWLRGYLFNSTPATLAARLAQAGLGGAESVLAELDGHFALIAVAPDWWVAAVDRVRSIPLLWTETPVAAVGDDAATLRGDAALDADQALMFGMAGFTLAGRTLYAGLHELKPGQWIGGNRTGETRVGRYYAYRPWRTRPRDRATLMRALTEVTVAVMEKTIASLDGRPVLVPLSGGLDSRLIAAALRHLNYSNVKCFAYGLPGNFEAQASRDIAARLGYDWTFVPLTPARQSKLFHGPLCADYLRLADSYTAVPFQQDLLAVSELLERGFVTRDAVVINGQSGDYITGNHVPPSLYGAGAGDADERWRRIVTALTGKHYSLWNCLKNAANLDRIATMLRQDLAEDGVDLGAPADDYAVYEYSEYQNRQAKYVVGGQRIYDFLGLDWRLPLWDRDYVDFWETVPLEFKQGQTLYRETLMADNWGGVWERASWPRTVTPAWMRPLRLLCKAAHLPFGRARWHRFERDKLAYWMDVVANYAVTPYARVATDRRGHRNAISWHVERYLRDKGLGIDGRPASP